MRQSALTVVFSLMVAGCAGVTGGDCGPDWRQIGERDGRLGAQPQAEIYAGRCAGKVDAARYAEGWQAGFALRPAPNW